MSRVGNHRGKVKNTISNRPKNKGFPRRTSHTAVSRPFNINELSTAEYKELVKRHSAAIEYLYDLEDIKLDLMIGEIQRLKAGKL